MRNKEGDRRFAAEVLWGAGGDAGYGQRWMARLVGKRAGVHQNVVSGVTTAQTDLDARPARLVRTHAVHRTLRWAHTCALGVAGGTGRGLELAGRRRVWGAIREDKNSENKNGEGM